jgi:D-glycero-D-manno-heptose 1,7-bisphosphate phosphatase
MAMIAGRPFLEILLTSLARKGFRHIVLSLGHMAEKVVSYFGDSFAGMSLAYEIETIPLGTGGALRRALARASSDNQAGVGRGYYTEQDFAELTAWMCDIFSKEKASIDKVYFCPTHPESAIEKYRTESDFRKPAPGMILLAAKEFNISLHDSILVGDKISDVEAGFAAGVGHNILYCAVPGVAPSSWLGVVVSDLREVFGYMKRWKGAAEADATVHP